MLSFQRHPRLYKSDYATDDINIEDSDDVDNDLETELLERE